MINSHLLYRLSYRGTKNLSISSTFFRLHRFPVSEARHFTYIETPVNTLIQKVFLCFAGGRADCYICMEKLE